MPNKKLPELLVPAGNMEKLETAIAYGADAVYLAGPGMHLRAASASFSWEDLGLAVSKAHAANVKAYVCVNAYPREQQLAEVRDHLARLKDFDIDGIIAADPGVIRLARRMLPHVELHVSTQANTANSETVHFWQEMGATRVNLARELDREAIAEIVRACPGMETEIFVHGAMCLSISGRCLLSDWVNDRAANMGQCTQPCRFKYRPMRLGVEEELRSGDMLWEVVEEESYSAMFAPDDLCLIEYLPWFCENGVTSLKIEGRMKTSSYLAQVVDAYRTALDDWARGEFAAEKYLGPVMAVAYRPVSTGFFLPGERRRVTPPQEGENWRVVARVLRFEGNEAVVNVKSAITPADTLAAFKPGLDRPEIPAGGFELKNAEGEPADRLHPGVTGIIRGELPPLSEGEFLVVRVRS